MHILPLECIIQGGGRVKQRGVIKRYVAEALVRRAGVPLARAAAMVEESSLGALMVGNLDFLSYKGPDYWAEKILEQSEPVTREK
jgi:hypothetical protein